VHINGHLQTLDTKMAACFNNIIAAMTFTIALVCQPDAFQEAVGFFQLFSPLKISYVIFSVL
jgi:hypothetical protein